MDFQISVVRVGFTSEQRLHFIGIGSLSQPRATAMARYLATVLRANPRSRAIARAVCPACSRRNNSRTSRVIRVLPAMAASRAWVKPGRIPAPAGRTSDEPATITPPTIARPGSPSGPAESGAHSGHRRAWAGTPSRENRWLPIARKRLAPYTAKSWPTMGRKMTLGMEPILCTYPGLLSEAGTPEVQDACLDRRTYLIEYSCAGLVDIARQLNQETREFGEEHDLPTIDLDVVVPKDADHFADSVHLTNMGAHLVAEAVALGLAESAGRVILPADQ